MRTATISTVFPISIIPTQMRYNLIKDMYELEGQKICEIQYDILASKWLKPTEVEQDGQTLIEQVPTDFITPVLFDSAKKIIPYELYLLIEQYRLTNDANLLTAINTALTQFEFQYSLEGFVLQVSNVE